MKKAQFRFYGALNDFLPKRQQQATIACTFKLNQSVKHLIESLGVPHVEVNRILVNEEEVDFGYLVQDGDEVEVYPIPQNAIRLQVADDHRFVLDNHLGRLAVYLRMLGFDAQYRNDYQDEELAQISSEERRVLLTRDVRLLMRNQVSHGYWVRSKIPRQQLLEIVNRFNLVEKVTPFRRCMRCNGVLKPVSKEVVLDRLEPLTKKYYDDFRICPDCEQIYWRGSHYERMQTFLQQVLFDANSV
ncbi:MAG: Mut7-C RNAse domain-containing protein [Anaerolineales bacterium]|jgi:hypothetical protein